MNQIELSPCTPGDLYTLQDIALNAYNDHYLYLWFDGGQWYIARCFSKEVLEKELANPNSAYYFIYSNNHLVGFLKLNLHQPFAAYTAAEALELERLYLIKSATSKGVGQEALRFTKAVAGQLHKRIIWLKTMDSSRATAFYEQNGFTKCGSHTLDFEQMKPEYRGMHILKLELGAEQNSKV